MSWLGALLVIVGLYLAFKLVGALLKLAMWLLVLVGTYWFLAPHLGWPELSEVVYVLGPDLDGKRIEEVVQPSNVAGEVADRVVDGVVERIGQALPGVAAAAPEPLPEPLPEATDGSVPPLPAEAGSGATDAHGVDSP